MSLSLISRRSEQVCPSFQKIQVFSPSLTGPLGLLSLVSKADIMVSPSITRYDNTTPPHSHMSDMTNISINIRYLLQDVERYRHRRTTNRFHTTERTDEKHLSGQYSLDLLMQERYCDMIHSTLIWESESRGMISAVIRALNEQLAIHDIPGEINIKINIKNLQ